MSRFAIPAAAVVLLSLCLSIIAVAWAAEKGDPRARWSSIEELQLTFNVQNDDTLAPGGGPDVRWTAHREGHGSCFLRRSKAHSSFGPRWQGTGSGSADIDVEVHFPKAPSFDKADKGGGEVKTICSFSTDFTTPGPGKYSLSVSLSGGECRQSGPTASSKSHSCSLVELGFEDRNTLSGSMTLSGSGMPANAVKDAHYTFTLVPAGSRPASTPVADPGRPYTVTRGESVKLDGSKSTGEHLTYRWTFSGHCQDGPPPSTSTALTTSTVEFLALCDFDATLEVSDGEKSDRKTTHVTATPRPWKLLLKTEPEGTFLATPPFRSSVSLQYAAGEERCARDIIPGSSPVPIGSLLVAQHVFHPHLDDGQSYRGHAYELKKVDDGGPFSGRWYVSDKLDELEVVRRHWINAYGLPGGPAAGRAIEDLYSANKRLGLLIDAYLAAVRAHEGEHTRRVGVALGGCDPLNRIERFVSDSEDDLRSRADNAIREADKAIDDFSDDPLPLTWEGSLAFPADDTGLYVDARGKPVLSVIDVGAKGTPARAPPRCE